MLLLPSSPVPPPGTALILSPDTLGETGGPLARPPRLPAHPCPPGGSCSYQIQFQFSLDAIASPASIHPICPSAICQSANPSVLLALRPRPRDTRHPRTEPEHPPCLSRGHSAVTQPGVASPSSPAPEQAGPISVLHVGREWTGPTDGLPPAHTPRIQRSTSRPTAGPWTLGLDDTRSRTYTFTPIVAQPAARSPPANTPTLIPQSPTAQSFPQRPASQ